MPLLHYALDVQTDDPGNGQADKQRVRIECAQSQEQKRVSQVLRVSDDAVDSLLDHAGGRMVGSAGRRLSVAREVEEGKSDEDGGGDEHDDGESPQPPRLVDFHERTAHQ